VGALAAVAQWLRLAVQLTPVQVAGSSGTALVVLLVFAARIGIRMSRIRGPQLPETAEDLQRHAEPIPAEEITSRTADADSYLTVLTITAAVGTCGTYPYLLAYGGFGTVLASLLAVTALLRARASHTVWQRVPMVVTGGLGAALVVLTLLRDLSQQAGTIGLILIVWVFVALMMAVTRPVTRRLLPIWGHLANVLETLSAVALIPVLLQLFHVYSTASGLFG
jgi:type VII secretion integral membrane protein EccD